MVVMNTGEVYDFGCNTDGQLVLAGADKKAFIRMTTTNLYIKTPRLICTQATHVVCGTDHSLVLAQVKCMVLGVILMVKMVVVLVLK